MAVQPLGCLPAPLLPAPGAASAATTSSSPSPVRAGAYAPRATPGAWRRPRRFLADHVLPCLPVRQWVLSLPKRLRYHLQHDREVLDSALRIVLDAIEQHLREHSPGAGPKARTGAVAFIHRLFAPSLGLTPSGPCYARPNSLLANLSVRR